MRCGCPECHAYMIQSEGDHTACACPDCGYRCNACMGTNTLISREELLLSREALALRMTQACQAEDEEED